MNLKALTVALVLGSSSVAMADTSFGYEVNAYGRWSSQPTVRDHRQYPTSQPTRFDRGQRGRVSDYTNDYRYQPRWTMLADHIEFNGAVTRTIHVGSRAGAFTTLQLDAVAGTPEIQQLWIQYDDGSEQAFHNLNVTLTRRAPLVLTLNTKARAIQKIVVYAPGYGTAKRQGSDFRDAEGVFQLTAR